MRQRRGSTRSRLTREVVVVNALALADAEGLDAVTIRRLAADLGVTPMALYWHFDHKDVLLDAVVDRVLAEIEVPIDELAETPAWHARLGVLFNAMSVGLRQHPAIAPLVHRRLMKCDPGLAINQICAAALSDAGFDEAQLRAIAGHAFNTIIASVTMPPDEDVHGLDAWYATGLAVLVGGIRAQAPASPAE